MMNTRLITALNAAGISAYRLSKISGIPYTTINELTTGKKDINRRSAETIVKLSAALDCDPSVIMNPTFVMDGVSGTYSNVKYHWFRKENHMVLELDYSGEKFCIETPYRFCDSRKRRRYDYATELYIDAFIKEKHLSCAAEGAFKRRSF